MIKSNYQYHTLKSNISKSLYLINTIQSIYTMKKLSTFVAILLSFAITMNAQPVGGKLNKSQKLKVANEQYEMGDYYNALDWYTKVLEEDKNDVLVIGKIAETHFQLRDLKEAQKWFEKVVNKDKSQSYPDAEFHYARILKMNGELNDAKAAFEHFGAESNNAVLKQLAQVELEGIQLLNNIGSNDDIAVSDAGDNINSPYTDFSPVYGSNGEMYYGAMAVKEVVVINGDEPDYFAKIYTANKSGDSWAKSSELGSNINRPGVHTGNVALSPDGNMMYFTRTEFSSNKMTASTLYSSTKGTDGWGPAYPVEGLGDYIVKHPAVGEMFGKDALFFVSDMAGGQGGYDIYYATIEGDKLGAAISIGKSINTIGDELTPYYSNGILYFSSTGHPGIGGFDAFSSEWTGSWSAPVNMGKEINSSYDDIYFNLDNAGYDGFVVSNRPSGRSLKSETCCDDIYDVNIKQVILDLEALSFTGVDGSPLQGVTVQLVEMMDGSEGETETDTKANGHIFGFPLAKETAYKIIASKEGFKDAVAQFNTAGLDKSQTVTKKMTLAPIIIEEVIVYDTIKSQQPIRLNNILYDFGKSTLRAGAEQDLNLVLNYMTQYPDLVIELGSHTDNIGKDGANIRLSQRRAEVAKNWFIGKGVSPDRVKSVGYGEAVPVAENSLDGGVDNPEGRKLNRRTEFKIIGGPKFVVTSRIEKRVIKKEVKN
ncbi:MAG: peptidoglycan-associated lipoprotein [Maribacter sp.]|jgi:peptidoglycan-associated lipoprotein